MDRDNFEISRTIGDYVYTVNITCDRDYVPSAIQYIDGLGSFGIIFIILGTILTVVTLCLSIDAAYRTIIANESKSVKRNVLLIGFVYPVASLCSLIALAVPRAQLLSETVTQIFLTIILYRLYLLLIDVGLRDVKKLPSLRLRAGPCCCWPCLPFPELQMNSNNLSWLQVIVLQLPIVQTLVYCTFAFMAVEDPLIAVRYGIFLQPLSITSILLGLYGLSITAMTLQDANPDLNLRHKAVVVQLVLLFSKLQGFVIKSLARTELFPCNPPITPQVYANLTYNALMLIEMLFLGYAARLVYGDNYSVDDSTDNRGIVVNVARDPENFFANRGCVNDDDERPNDKDPRGMRIETDGYNRITNNNVVGAANDRNASSNGRMTGLGA